MAHVENSVSMQQHFEQFVGKQRRVELQSVGNFVAKTVLVESANHVSLEQLCRTQYSLKYFLKPYCPSDRLEKTLNHCNSLEISKLFTFIQNYLHSFKINDQPGVRCLRTFCLLSVPDHYHPIHLHLHHIIIKI